MKRAHLVVAEGIVLSCLGVGLAGCGPSTRALIGVSGTSAGPVVTLYVCDDEPNLTVRVYTAQNDTDFYTLSGHARRHETVRVPLTLSSTSWRLTGTRTPLPVGSTIEADSEDGAGNRLGSAVYFKLEDLPRSPQVVVGRGPLKVLSAADFTRSAGRVC